MNALKCKCVKERVIIWIYKCTNDSKVLLFSYDFCLSHYSNMLYWMEEESSRVCLFSCLKNGLEFCQKIFSKSKSPYSRLHIKIIYTSSSSYIPIENALVHLSRNITSNLNPWLCICKKLIRSLHCLSETWYIDIMNIIIWWIP